MIWKQGNNVHFLQQDMSLVNGRFVEGAGYDSPGVPSVRALKMILKAAAAGVRQGGGEATVTLVSEGDLPADVNFYVVITRTSDEKSIKLDTSLTLSEYIRRLSETDTLTAYEDMVTGFRNNGLV